MKFQENDKVKFKSSIREHKGETFSVFGYADPYHNDMIYLMGKDHEIITTDENSLEYVIEQLKYKGLTSTPEYDDEKEVYHGHIEGVMFYFPWDSETFEGCQAAFQDAVDEYLEVAKAVKVDTTL